MRLQHGRHKGQRKGRDEVARHEIGFELVVRVARDVGAVVAQAGEGCGGEGHCDGWIDGCGDMVWCWEDSLKWWVW